MRRFLPPLFLLAVASISSAALAGHDHAPAYFHRLTRVEVFDRTAGRLLPVHAHETGLYVVGEPGHRYEVRLANRTDQRLLAVVSVDGVNVVNGKTANTQQSGYVLDAWEQLDIEGWRKSLAQVATFYFTRLSKSYAARTGWPENVGVIGVALFRERQLCCKPHPFEDRDSADAQSSAHRAEAPSEDSLVRQQAEKLGTGHGHRETSLAEYVDFQRKSNTPDETIVIYYDSRKNLLARGVNLDSHHANRDAPNPFPDGSFVPDP